VPAAAVIPAPVAYIKVVAVKKLVVGTVSHAVGSSPVGVTARLYQWDVQSVRCWSRQAAFGQPAWFRPHAYLSRCSSSSVLTGRLVYFEQIRVLKAGYDA
jgi:hypothetical protein